MDMLSTFVVAAVAVAAQGGSNGPRIVVEGYGSVETAADVANISFEIRGEGITNDQALADLVRKSQSVERGLRSIDPAIQLNSDTMRVQAVRGKDCDGDSYEGGTPQLSTAGCAVKGYVAVQEFGARTSRVKDAGTLVGLAGRKGAHSPKLSSFGLASDKTAKRLAIASALEDAKSKAEAVAAGSGARLGETLAVALDGARDSETLTLNQLNAPPPAAERDEPVIIDMKPEPVRTYAKVSVTYAISR
jgi:uncharacterized protein YggE